MDETSTMSQPPTSAAGTSPSELEAAIDTAAEKVLVQTHELDQLAAGKPGQPFALNGLLDVQVTVTVEVGRAKLSLGELARLGPGSLIELDREVHEHADIRVNGKLVARGEIVTIGSTYGVRITRLEKAA
ncbi:MAG: flagellar motor switch protein FliN [Planctomycetota bacterium]|nr:MAG: flagellar motor switch protein FliN [Planctomycetota bacterium]